MSFFSLLYNSALRNEECPLVLFYDSRLSGCGLGVAADNAAREREK